MKMLQQTGLFIAALAASQVVQAADYYLNLQCAGTQWVCAEGGGGGREDGADSHIRGRVVADRASPGLWEEFILKDLNGGSLTDGDSVTLRTRANGQFVSAEGGGGGRVIANRPLGGGYETFTIKKMNGTGTIQAGDAIALQASNGQWVCAEGGGGYPLVANRPSPGAWETFSILLIGATPLTYWSAPGYLGSLWNDYPNGVIQVTNNCYNYAVNRMTNTQAQPGDASGYPMITFTTFSLDLGLYKDGLEPTTQFAFSPESKMKIYVAIWPPATDFHFYRQDSSGMWSGKPGTTPATDLDHSGMPISDPSTANRGPYTWGVGYYFAPNLGSSQGGSFVNVK
jgi:hypothetical protein